MFCGVSEVDRLKRHTILAVAQIFGLEELAVNRNKGTYLLSYHLLLCLTIHTVSQVVHLERCEICIPVMFSIYSVKRELPVSCPR